MSSSNAQVYARVELSDTVSYFGAGVKQTYATGHIRYYSDAYCTIPTTIPNNIDVALMTKDYLWIPYYATWPSYYVGYPATANDYETLIYGELLIEETIYEWDDFTYDVVSSRSTKDWYLESTSDYIAMPTVSNY